MKKRYWVLLAVFLFVVASLIFGEDETAKTKETAKETVKTTETKKAEEKDAPKKEANKEKVKKVEKVEKKETTKKEASSTKTSLGNIQIRPLMNGTRTERIGEYALINSDKSFATKENLLKFFKEDVSKVEDANFLVVDLNDGTGLHVVGGMPLVTYGQFDKEDHNVSQQWESIIVDVGAGTVKGTMHEGVPANKALITK
ncbi:hypothetical protein [Exiguobacterium sp. s130]|uniref:hypothetical protein n=1 Tax=Exiguobacterium sp. s130 TaxID=2751190 RepID=UPI001BE51B0E|nr:hypothetical protein [Exiguobacterium sp. s130]